MFITEIELRELWRDGRNPLPAFPPGTRFSPAAQDFLKDQRLEIQYAAAAPVAGGLPQTPTTTDPWPVALDALHALALLTGAEARRYQLPALARRLDALAADCLELRTAQTQGRDPAPLTTPAPASGALNFSPGPGDHAILHWLNLLRANAREVSALASAGRAPQVAARLEQISAAAADLGGRVQSGELGWNSAMV